MNIKRKLIAIIILIDLFVILFKGHISWNANSIIAIAVIILVFNVFMWFGLVRGILVSLGKIKTGTEIIKTIKLDHRIGLKTKDELGDLARSFDAMAEALQKSRETGLSLTEYTNNIISSMNDALLVVSVRDGRIERANKAASELLGYSENELLGKSIGNIFLIKSITNENILIDKMRKASLKNAELECETKDKRRIPVIFSSSVVKDKDGNSHGIVCIAKDISDIKIAQKALKESEEKYRTIIEHSNDLIWILDKNGNFAYLNKQTEQTSGYKLSDYLGKSFEPMIFSEDIPKVKRILLETLSGKSMHYDVNIVREDGGLLSLSVNTTPFLDSGEIVGTVSFGHDITERKLAEEALKKSEERYKTIIENTLDILYSCNPEGIVTFVSPTVIGFAGYLPEEIIGRNLLEFMHPEDVPKALENLTKALESESLELLPNIYRLRKKDGTYIYTEEVSKIIKKDGKLVQLNGVVRDISERRRLEAQLAQSQRLEVIGKLAGGIAHDFNNLMTAILGYASLILSRVTADEQLKGDLNEIRKAGERAASLTKQLLAFSRKQTIRTENMNLNSLISDMDKMLHRVIGEDIQLSLLFEPELKNIEIDPVQIEQVVINLVINARDAMPKGGRIIIKTENVKVDEKYCKDIGEARPGEFISLTVSDTGIGMGQNVLEHLFEPFFTTKDFGKGTGLGLAMAYGIIKQHKGWITVQSKLDEGSEFKVYLPVSSSKDIPRKSEKGDTILLDDYRGNGERILLIEDEEIVRRYASRVLAQNGYNVFEAKDASEAMKIFQTENGDFHLIFSDIILPDKNGIELVQELSLKNTKTKVIFSSGYSDEKSQSELILQAGVEFLHKPYKASDLLIAVRNLLDSDKA